MSSRIKNFLLLIAAFLLLCSIYFSVRIFVGYRSGYEYEVMDWNQDGKTSIAEIIESSDVGARQTIVNGVECVEYFAYKDGLPIKVVCPN
jgi:hypothetical protein